MQMSTVRLNNDGGCRYLCGCSESEESVRCEVQVRVWSGNWRICGPQRHISARASSRTDLPRICTVTVPYACNVHVRFIQDSASLHAELR
jgi:hypothetical protein